MRIISNISSLNIKYQNRNFIWWNIQQHIHTQCCIIVHWFFFLLFRVLLILFLYSIFSFPSILKVNLCFFLLPHEFFFYCIRSSFLVHKKERSNSSNKMMMMMPKILFLLVKLALNSFFFLRSLSRVHTLNIARMHVAAKVKESHEKNFYADKQLKLN